MLLLLLVIALSIPILEIVAVIRVNEIIGAGWTVTLLVATSLAGIALVRREGARAIARSRAALARGEWPGDAVARGAAAVVGGILLVAPGFVTDVVGLLLIFSPTRGLIVGALRRRRRWKSASDLSSSSSPRPPITTGPGHAANSVLDVEVVEVRRSSAPDSTDAPSGDSPAAQPTPPDRGSASADASSGNTGRGNAASRDAASGHSGSSSAQRPEVSGDGGLADPDGPERER